MQNLFIAGGMLANWDEAFPASKIFTAVTPAVINMAQAPESILWLHEVSGKQVQILDTISDILQAAPAIKLVVLSNVPDKQQALHVMNAGAFGYCHAYSSPEALKEVHTVVLHGGLWLGRDLLQRLIRATGSLTANTADQVESALSKLTQREREVAVEAAQGFSNKVIARKLGITERTVKAHISACFERLGVRDRLHLALILNAKSKP